MSDADDKPCTRCAQKGLTCEYLAVSDDDSSRPGTPEDTSPPTRGWSSHPQTVPPITPPSAGISGFLSAGPPRGASRNSGYAGANPPYPQAGVQPYPYRSNHMPSAPSTSGARPPRPRSYNSAPYPPPNPQAPPYPYQHQQQGYSQPTQYPSGPYSNANYGQAYAPQTYHGQSSQQWSQAMLPMYVFRRF